MRLKELLFIFSFLSASLPRVALAGYTPWGWQGWLQSVPTISLAPTTGVQLGSAIEAQDTLGIYVWNGSAWVINPPSGTVTSFSFTNANGFTGVVTNPNSTPDLTLGVSFTGIAKGNGTALSAATADTDYQLPISLTTTGTSGAATFIGDVLNIPQYAGMTYTASDSIVLTGSNFTLVNDSATPAASNYYGTDSGSVLGYHSLPSGVVPGGSSGDVQFNNSGSFGGNNNLYWDNVNDYLGIGTNSPTAALTVSSPNVEVAVFNGTGNNNMELVLNSATGHNSNFGFQNTGANEWYFQNSSAANSFDILNSDVNGNSNVFTILQSGNIGIGTAAPASTLEVNGTIQEDSATPSTLTVFNASNQLVSGSVSSPLTFAAGALGCQTVSGSQPGCVTAAQFNAWLSSISINSSNGFAGSSSGGATPALTISTTVNGIAKGNGTAFSAATAGTDYSAGTSALATGILKSTTGTGALSIAAAGTDYQAPITLTTTGTSGAATFSGGTLNIPQYAGTTYTASDSVSLTGSNFTLKNDSASPTASQYYGTNAGSVLGYYNIPSGFTNPMTTLGDIIFENATPVAARLAGSTSATQAVLTQTGTGVVSASPAWTSITTLFQSLYETVATTAGDLIYGGASGTPTRLALGTAGQYLTVNGGATAPVWATGPNGASPANWAGTSTLTGTTTSTSFADFGSVSGSVTVSGTPSNVTCSAASSLVGITCTLPASTGNYQICFAGSASNGTLGDTAYTQLVDGSGAVIVGSQEVYSAAASSTGPVGSCGGYTTSSTSVTFKVQGKVNAGTETLLATSFSVFSVQNGGNVSSTGTGRYHHQSAYFAGSSITSDCTSSPCTVYGPDTAWISSIIRTGTGLYTVNFTPGVFTATPVCGGSININGVNNVAIFVNSAQGSSSSVEIFSLTNTLGSEADGEGAFWCAGN